MGAEEEWEVTVTNGLRVQREEEKETHRGEFLLKVIKALEGSFSHSC